MLLTVFHKDASLSWSQMGALQTEVQALEILQVVASKAVPEEEATLPQSKKTEHFADRRL